MEVELTRFQKVKLAIFGKVYLENRNRKGWNGSLPFYAAKCPIHGIFVDYPSGWKERLICPKCREEFLNG